MNCRVKIAKRKTGLPLLAPLFLLLLSLPAKGDVSRFECSSIFARLLKYRTIASENSLVQYGTAELTELPRSGVRVLLWNAHKQTHPNWKGDFVGMRNSADIYLIQEAALATNTAPNSAMAGKEWTMARSFAVKNMATGVVTGSDRRARSSVAVRSPVYEPILRTPKASLVSEFAIEGREEKLMVINVHAINFTNLKKFKAQLNHLFPHIDGHKGPIIVAGDMNTWNPWRSSYLKTMLADHGLEEAIPTNDQRMLVLDRVFIRGMKMKSGKIIQDVWSSDHKPQSFEFEFD